MGWQGWLVLIVLIAYCAAFTFFGIKICLAVANMVGVDPKNIPDKTYAPTGVYIGSIMGFAAMVMTGSVIVGLLATLVIGLAIFLIIFFIEIGINKATRPLTDKIEEKIDNAFGAPKQTISKPETDLTPLERIKREDDAKEQAANERKLLEAGGWRCAKCGKVNVASIGFCSCGTSRGESKKIIEESKKHLEEMQKGVTDATNAEVTSTQNTAPSAVASSINSATATATATAASIQTPFSGNARAGQGLQTSVNIADYDLNILNEEIEGSKWKCLKCQTINPKLVSSCKCGNTLEHNNKIIDALKAHKAQLEKEAREESERLKAAMENEKAALDNEILDILKKAGIDNPEIEEKTVLRLLKQSKDSMSMTDICHKLPRSADIKAYQKAVDNLASKGIIGLDENHKYYINE